jgi:hypothetical protein
MGRRALLSAAAFPFGDPILQWVAGLARCVDDKPLAMVAAAMIVGLLLAQFAFVRDAKEQR